MKEIVVTLQFSVGVKVFYFLEMLLHLDTCTKSRCFPHELCFSPIESHVRKTHKSFFDDSHHNGSEMVGIYRKHQKRFNVMMLTSSTTSNKMERMHCKILLPALMLFMCINLFNI
jgi:hypothetical protein